jgi:hypothetical protein
MYCGFLYCGFRPEVMNQPGLLTEARILQQRFSYAA